jgi:hypothetical protein
MLAELGQSGTTAMEAGRNFFRHLLHGLGGGSLSLGDRPSDHRIKREAWVSAADAR